VILLTAFGDAHTHDEAERLGAVAIFDKPFEIDDLLAKTRELLGEGRTRALRDPAQGPSSASNTRCASHRARPGSGSTSDASAESGGKKKP
jgi:DNA-binding response OmpR family regulator